MQKLLIVYLLAATAARSQRLTTNATKVRLSLAYIHEFGQTEHMAIGNATPQLQMITFISSLTSHIFWMSL